MAAVQPAECDPKQRALSHLVQGSELGLSVPGFDPRQSLLDLRFEFGHIEAAILDARIEQVIEQ